MPKLTYFSHSAWQIESNGTTILIDPFLNDNPTSPVKASDVRADYIIITHAHGDHIGDSIPIAKRDNATIISNFEIANWCAAQGVTAHPMHIGGAHDFPFGNVKLTQAFHGSSFPDGSYGGMPVGVLVTINGKTLYHSGDTGLFSDMKLIGEMTPIDLALLPIGDNFTMGLEDAVRAVEFLKPKKVIPMHYQTFDVINTDPATFVAKAKTMGIEAQILAYGESVEY